jgi:hypothetical protein
VWLPALLQTKKQLLEAEPQNDSDIEPAADSDSDEADVSAARSWLFVPLTVDLACPTLPCPVLARLSSIGALACSFVAGLFLVVEAATMLGGSCCCAACGAC